MNTCPICEAKKPDRVSIWGMYDCHLFHPYTGATVDEVIKNWLTHISKPIPAVVGGKEVADLGPTVLCPAIVLCGEQEVRRVGEMIHVSSFRRRPEDYKALHHYRKALLDDADIPRLLAGLPFG